MGLIHQKYIVTLYSLLKKSLQVYIRVENIIVVADYIIAPGRHIQTHFKRTDLMLSGMLKQVLPHKHVFFLQQLIDCIIHPVKVSPGIWTINRITLHLIAETHLLLGSNLYDFCPIAVIYKSGKSLPRHRCRYGLCRQVKNPVPQPLAYGLDCRKNSRYCLAYTSRSLKKKIFPAEDCPVYILHQLLLPFSVLEGKLQLLYGFLSYFLKAALKIRPFPV